MKIPPVFARARILPFALSAALSLAAGMATAESLPGAEPESKNGALADAAELEALSTWHSKLERGFDAKLATQHEALVERALNENTGSLAALHDAKLRQRNQLDTRIDAQLAGLLRTPGHEYIAVVADRSGTIARTPIPTHTLPAAPAP